MHTAGDFLSSSKCGVKVRRTHVTCNMHTRVLLVKIKVLRVVEYVSV